MTLTKQGHMVTLFCFQKMQNMLIYNQEKFQTLAVKLETTHKPAKPLGSQANHPQTSHIQDKSPTNQPIMRRKSVFYVTRNFSDIAKHVLSLQPFYVIALRFSNEDQSQVGIEGK